MVGRLLSSREASTTNDLGDLGMGERKASMARSVHLPAKCEDNLMGVILWRSWLQGCRPVGRVAQVTGVNGNAITHLDNQPALFVVGALLFFASPPWVHRVHIPFGRPTDGCLGAHKHLTPALGRLHQSVIQYLAWAAKDWVCKLHEMLQR